MSNTVSLNQTYRVADTKQKFPAVQRFYDHIAQVSRLIGFVRPHDGSPKGRIYDDAVLMVLAGGPQFFKKKKICELGGRDGIFGGYLARWAESVHISDYFEHWGKGTDHDLGQLDYWTAVWRSAAGPHAHKLVTGTQDMLDLTFDDNQFDCVVSTSVIEHIYIQKQNEQGHYCGDIAALEEMIRICKPGGLILLSTDMVGNNQRSQYHAGTFYYNETDLFGRLIERHDVELIQMPNMPLHSFDMSEPGNDAVGSHDHISPVCPVVFGLRVIKN